MVAFATNSAGDESAAKKRDAALRQAIVQLSDSIAADDKPTAADVRLLRDRSFEFQRAVRQKAPSDTAYEAAIAELTDSIRSAAQAPNVESTRITVRNLNADLETKLSFVHARAGLATEQLPLVKVTVATSRNGKPAPGLLVYCNPYRFADSERQFYPFPKASTPTDTSLVPGNYRCFATQVTGKGPEKLGYRDARVGLDGANAMNLDIVIP